MKEQLQHLLNKINRVTCAHRHGQKVSSKDLDTLSNAQIEFEEAYKQVLVKPEVIKNFEKYLKENIKNGIIDFSIRTSEGNDGIEFYIHPAAKDGETLDYWVEGDVLISRNVYRGSTRIIKDHKNSL